MKTLVILPYYNRPKLLLNALVSLRDSSDQNWTLAFIDDASPTDEGLCSVDVILSEQVKKGMVHKYVVPVEEKEQLKWTTQPVYMNRAMREIASDLTLILCDDDALLVNYIENSVKWFTEHPNELYGFSNVRVYFPPKESPSEILPIRPFHTNHLQKVCPVNTVDASQVVWRSKVALERGCFFDEARQYDHDASMWEAMWRSGYGECPYMGFYGQYKGIHQFQLGRMKGITDHILREDI
jgi:hypothetical protein